MRRALMSMLLCGCFNEPEPVDKTASSTAVSTTVEPMETSSGEGESSSDDGSEENSSSGEPFDPRACPDWCTETCDSLVGFERCRCANDAICSLGGFTCHDEENVNGHCY